MPSYKQDNIITIVHQICITNIIYREKSIVQNITEKDFAPGDPAPLRANLPNAAWLRTICF